jgi:hypothetical protein
MNNDMSRYLGLFSLFLFNAFSTFSQETNVNWRLLNSMEGNKIEFEGVSLISSNKFDRVFVASDFWDRESINQQLDRSGTMVRFGLVQNGHIAYSWIDSLKPTQSKSISYQYNNLLGIDLDNELISMALKGNRQFRGQIIDISNSGIENLSYSSLRFGRAVAISEQSKISYGISAILGHNYLRLSNSEGTILTDSSGDFIDLNMSFNQMKSSHNSVSGLGAGIDFSFTQKKLNNTFCFSISNLGVTRWADISSLREKEKQQRFDGILIPNISEFEGQWLDTLSEQYTVSDTLSKLVLNPFRFRSNLIQDLNHNQFIRVQLDYLHLVGYIPQILASYGFQSHKTLAEIGVTFGGYSGVRSSLQFEQLIGGLGVGVGLQGIESIALSNLPISFQGNIRLSFLLGRKVE